MDLKDVETLAKARMKEFGLVRWRLRFINSKSVAGRCWTTSFNEIPEDSFGIIELSRDFMEVFDVPDVEEVIRHEIAHGRTNPKYSSHGPEWKAMARSIGSTGERCVSQEAPRIASKWTGVCSGGHEFHRHRLTWRMRTESYCNKCSTPKKRAFIRWIETKDYQKLKSTVTPKDIDLTPSKAPVAAQSAPKSEATMSWKEKYDRGVTEIDW